MNRNRLSTYWAILIGVLIGEVWSMIVFVTSMVPTPRPWFLELLR
jgi:hypothetical protein